MGIKGLRTTLLLKEKTDAECRELAGHYYRRARRAEKERDQLLAEVEALQAECEKLVGALELVVTTHDEGGWPTATITIARAALAFYRKQLEEDVVT